MTDQPIVQSYIILTAEQETAAEALNGGEFNVRGRLIDNPLANNLGEGTLVGKYVVAARILNTQGYAPWTPTLGTYDIRTMGDDTLFLPLPPI